MYDHSVEKEIEIMNLDDIFLIANFFLQRLEFPQIKTIWKAGLSLTGDQHSIDWTLHHDITSKT